MKLNRYFFEALRTRMENILRALSGNRKAHIIFGTSTCTDVENQVVLEPRDRIVPNVPCSLVELYLFYKACTAHEGGHVRYTSKKAWEEAIRRGPVFQHIVNIIEDGRIEAAVGQELPGAGRWLKFMNQYIFKHRTDYGSGPMEFLGGLCAYSVCGRIPPSLSPEAVHLVKLVAPYVDIGKAAPTTEKVLEVAEEILEIPEIQQLFDAFAPPPLQENKKGTNSPQQVNPSQAVKERAEKARTLIMQRQSVSQQGKNEDQSDSTGASSKAANPENAGKSPKGRQQSSKSSEPSNQLSKKTSEPDTSASGSNKNPDSPAERKSDPTESHPEENWEHSEEENPSGNSSEGNQDDGSEETTGSTDSNSEDDWLDNEEDANESFDSGDSDQFSGDDELEDNPEDDQEIGGDPDQTSSPKEAGEESEDEYSDPEDSAQNGENGAEDNLEKDPEKDFFEDVPFEEDFTELITSSEEEIQGISQEAREMEEANQTVTVNTGYHNRRVNLTYPKVTSSPRKYQTLKKTNERLIKQLIEEIRVAMETKKTYFVRNLNRGRLSSNSLYRLAIPDAHIFEKKKAPGDIPELAICIMMDLSGSMDNDIFINGKYVARIDKAKDAACVISETCRELKIPHKIIGFNAHQDMVFHYNIVDWDDTDSTKIASVTPDHFNRDGYSIRKGAEELLNRPEERKILLVLSDGLPQVFLTYPNEIGVKDTHEAVQKIRKMGIEVISLFLGDASEINDFKYMYSNPVFINSINLLPIRLGEVFKKVLLN